MGDFYFQTERMAGRKAGLLSWVFIHGLWYWAAVLTVMLPVFSWETIAFGTIAALSHLAIDLVKYFYISGQKKRMTPAKDQLIFMTDQLLHIGCLIVTSYFFTVKAGGLNACKGVTEFFSVVGVSGGSALSWAAVLLIIHKPANIAIAKMLTIYRPQNKISDARYDKNAGRFIGTIERIIILIFISIQQYSAIGLVLTAKSIARYDKIAKEPEFAEYYLLGTLLSTAAVIITSFILV